MIIIQIKQRGVAILVAVFFVALISSIAISIVYTQQLNVQRLSNILQRDQAYLFAMAGEPWFTELINGRVRFEGWKPNAQQIDAVNREALKKASFAIEIMDKEGKHVLGDFEVIGVEDLQGKFNLTNLIDIKTGEVNATQQAALVSLLSGLDDPAPPEGFKENAEIIVDSIIDWIDENPEPMPNGAEDVYYQGLSDEKNKPYSTPNRVMSSVTELLKVRGMDIPGINKYLEKELVKYICVLPRNTRLNINTADKAVIKSVLAITDDEAGQFIKESQKNGQGFLGFENMNDVYGNAELKKVLVKRKKTETHNQNPPQPPTDLSEDQKQQLNEIIDVKSEYFLIKTQATYGDAVLQMESVLKVDRGQETGAPGATPQTKRVTILVRSQGTY